MDSLEVLAGIDQHLVHGAGLLTDANERLKGDKSERGSAEADRDFALAQLEALGKKS